MLGAFGAVLGFVQANGGSIRMKRAFAQWLASALLDILPAALAETFTTKDIAPEMPRIEINDINLYYEIHGEGAPLLLIYGLAGRGAGFARQIPALSERFRVIIFDNRGVGETDQPEEPYSIPQMADDAAGLLDALGIESAHVFGVSMGGMIAQELALRYPDSVKKLALGCTHSGIKHCAPSPQWVTDIFKSLPGKPRQQVVRECVV